MQQKGHVPPRQLSACIPVPCLPTLRGVPSDPIVSSIHVPAISVSISASISVSLLHIYLSPSQCNTQMRRDSGYCGLRSLHSMAAKSCRAISAVWATFSARAGLERSKDSRSSGIIGAKFAKSRGAGIRARISLWRDFMSVACVKFSLIFFPLPRHFGGRWELGS